MLKNSMLGIEGRHAVDFGVGWWRACTPSWRIIIFPYVFIERHPPKHGCSSLLESCNSFSIRTVGNVCFSFAVHEDAVKGHLGPCLTVKCYSEQRTSSEYFMSVQEAVAERDNVHDPFTDVGFSNPSDSAFYNPYRESLMTVFWQSLCLHQCILSSYRLLENFKYQQHSLLGPSGAYMICRCPYSRSHSSSVQRKLFLAIELRYSIKTRLTSSAMALENQQLVFSQAYGPLACIDGATATKH